jgi:hypothetical protein
MRLVIMGRLLSMVLADLVPSIEFKLPDPVL